MSKNLIDVHILHMPDENQDWWEICEESLKGHPINIYHCNGIQDNIGEARRLGYEKGTAPYVSFVDPDDIVQPGTFEKCLEALEHHPEACGVYTLSEVLYTKRGDSPVETRLMRPYRPWSFANMTTHYQEIHQIVVMRREDVFDYHTNFFPRLLVTNVHHNNMMYLHMAVKKPWIAIDYIGYKWRNHPNGAHHGKNEHPDTSRLAYSVMDGLVDTFLKSVDISKKD